MFTPVLDARAERACPSAMRSGRSAAFSVLEIRSYGAYSVGFLSVLRWFAVCVSGYNMQCT